MSSLDHEARTELIIRNCKNPMFLARQFLVDNPNLVFVRDLDGHKLIYVYNGICWNLVGDDDLKPLIYKFYSKFNLETFCKPAKINELLQSLYFGVELATVEMNVNPDNIVVANGVLNLNTLQLSPHAPGYFYDSYVPVDYDPTLTEADCPIFMSFLREVLSDNEMYINNALMLGGYLFDYSLAANKLFFFDGPGGSGKSTLQECYLMFWNENQISSLFLDEITAKGFDKEALINSRVNVAGEQKRSYIDAEALKLLAEGARVSISRKFLKTISLKLRAKILLACNGMPKFSDTSDGIFRRLCIFSFRNRYKPSDDYKEELAKGEAYVRSMRIKEQDRGLLAKIKAEKSAIFNVFLKYLKILRERKYAFHNSVTDIRDFKTDNDTLAEFLITNYVITDSEIPNEWLTSQEIFDHYREWYADNVGNVNTLKLRTNELGRRITEEFGDVSSDKKKVVKEIDGKITRHKLYRLRRTLGSFNETVIGLADGSLVADPDFTVPTDNVDQINFLD